MTVPALWPVMRLTWNVPSRPVTVVVCVLMM
jgi:hypothetical protein